MHHLFFGINFQIHSVSLTILVLLHLIVDFSTHLCHHPHYRHRSLLHSFLQAENLPFQENPSHRRFMLPTVLPHDNGTGPAVTLIILFLPGIRSLEQRARYFFCFIFLFVCFFLFGQRFLDNPRAESRRSLHAGVAWVGT